MDWIYYFILLLVLIVGLIVTIIGLPGLWLMVFSVLLYAWVTHWVHIALPGLIAMCVLGIIAEVLEFVMGSAGAKAAGGSKRAMFAAVVGALIGGIVASPILPIIGTVIGAIAGAFIGAAVVETMLGKQLNHSIRVGVGAAKGRFWGIVAKAGIGLIMLLLALILAFPARGRVNNAPLLPATLPTTAAAQ